MQSGGVIGAEANHALAGIGIGTVGIVIGLATYGWRVIQTIGQKITELTPSRLPRSSRRHQPLCSPLPLAYPYRPLTLVGAVLGVG